MKWVLFAILGLSYLCLSSCSSHPRFETGQRSLIEIRQAISSIVGKPRQVSSSQRELWSYYFSRDMREDFDPEKAKQRFYAVITIFNDVRPYKVQVEVMSQRRIRGEFKDEGTDKELSYKIAEDIKNKLNESRDGRNVIDDFRAF
jgi:hypothetical protein